MSFAIPGSTLTVDRRSPTRRSIRRHLLAGTVLIALLAGGLGGWAATTSISGALIAPGMLVVESSVKKVQHPTGGVVGELKVREGDRVRTGDILIRLDDTQVRANLAIVNKAIDELTARQSRDEAERDGAGVVTFPPDLVARAAADPSVAQVVEGERRLFNLRANARQGQKAQLLQRIGQLKDEIKGLTDQTVTKRREIGFIQQELAGLRSLYERSLIPLNRVNALERDAARIEGELGQLGAAVAQANGKITETELQVIQIDQDLRMEVGKDMSEIRARLAELVEKKVSAEDQLKRIDIRSPIDGTVHQLNVHTIGGVVTPSEAVMLLVPAGDILTVEARLPPNEIDNVHDGQPAILRFTAFNQRTTPELKGTVQRVSADISQDPKTGQSFYTVRIQLDPGEQERLEGRRLVPGMPVESFIQTGERTVISYLTKPLADQVARAWRER
jgi:HlyD family secretion protein